MKQVKKILFSVGLCLAQGKDSTSSSPSSSLKYYLSLGADNELLMKVNVWGEAKKTGIVGCS